MIVGSLRAGLAVWRCLGKAKWRRDSRAAVCIGASEAGDRTAGRGKHEHEMLSDDGSII